MLKWLEEMLYGDCTFQPLFESVLSDNEVVDLIQAIPEHEGVTYTSATSNTGITTATAPAAAGTTWTLTSLSISQSGPTIGPNSKLTIWDGAVGTGTAIFTAYLSAPGAAFGGASGLGGSVGIIQDIPLPKTPGGVQSIQASPGNALNVQVVGTGGNNVAINARFSDALPPV